MIYSREPLAKFLKFANGRSSPERQDHYSRPVFGSNGLIGFAREVNSPANTIIIGRVGSYCGSLHFSKEECWVTDNAIKAVARDPSESRFWFYALQNASLNNLRSGSGQPLINQTALNSLALSVPPDTERKRIGDLLGSLDDKIEMNRRMNETLERMAQAIFRDWFVDFGPVRRKMEGASDPVKIMGGLIPGLGAGEEVLRQAQDEAGSPSANATTKKLVTQNKDEAARLAALFPAALADNGLPEGWEEKPLKVIVEQHKETLTPANSPDELFAHYSLPAYDVGQTPVIETGENIRSNKTIIPDRAVLLSKLNPEIKRIWLPFNEAGSRRICSTEFLAYTAAKPFGRAFVYCLFSSDEFRSLLAGMVTGTSKSHQRVSPKSLAERFVIAPPESILETFEAVAAPMLESTLHNKQENQTLAAMRDLLLPRLMSGEIHLKDVEKIAEAAE